MRQYYRIQEPPYGQYRNAYDWLIATVGVGLCARCIHRENEFTQYPPWKSWGKVRVKCTDIHPDCPIHGHPWAMLPIWEEWKERAKEHETFSDQ